MAEVTIDVYIEKLAKLKHNESNPRIIKSKKHKELIKSLTEFPEMKLLREIIIDENDLILAGDKRAYALEEMGYKEVAVKKVSGLSEAKKREFIAKDNIHSGEWDQDIIANEWDTDLLKDWGLDSFKMPDPAGQDDKPRKGIDTVCPHCGEEFNTADAAE